MQVMKYTHHCSSAVHLHMQAPEQPTNNLTQIYKLIKSVDLRCDTALKKAAPQQLLLPIFLQRTKGLVSLAVSMVGFWFKPAAPTDWVDHDGNPIGNRTISPFVSHMEDHLVKHSSGGDPEPPWCLLGRCMSNRGLYILSLLLAQYPIFHLIIGTDAMAYYWILTLHAWYQTRGKHYRRQRSLYAHQEIQKEPWLMALPPVSALVGVNGHIFIYLWLVATGKAFLHTTCKGVLATACALLILTEDPAPVTTVAVGSAVSLHWDAFVLLMIALYGFALYAPPRAVIGRVTLPLLISFMEYDHLTGTRLFRPWRRRMRVTAADWNEPSEFWPVVQMHITDAPRQLFEAWAFVKACWDCFLSACQPAPQQRRHQAQAPQPQQRRQQQQQQQRRQQQQVGRDSTNGQRPVRQSSPAAAADRLIGSLTRSRSRSNSRSSMRPTVSQAPRQKRRWMASSLKVLPNTCKTLCMAVKSSLTAAFSRQHTAGPAGGRWQAGGLASSSRPVTKAGDGAHALPSSAKVLRASDTDSRDVARKLDEKLCVICQDALRTHVLVHTDSAHFCMCGECVEAYDMRRGCPLCREAVVKCVRMFD